jgi:enolase
VTAATATIAELRGLEVLDSRGRPTVLATCRLASGARARASVPSGASTGAGEARELRDGDPARHRGLGCRRAAAGIGGEIAAALRGRRLDQAELDAALRELDGTPDKRRLGANALLAVSLAFARAVARERGEPLFAHLARLAGVDAPHLPRPMVNLFSGGKHAGGQVAIQDVQVMPLRTRDLAELLAVVAEVYRCAAEAAARRYGTRELTADEGGLAPPFPTPEAMLEAGTEAIAAAGLEPGRDVALTVDVAASHLRGDGGYDLGDGPLSSAEMVERMAGWVGERAIVSLEDGLAEDDWESWPALARRLRGRALTLGDDLLCTDPVRVARAARAGAADALLLKVNQVGTLSEAAEALRVARTAGWRVVASARSGETEDDWLADLAAGWAADHIKVGSITQSERLAKYNRLLVLEAEHGLELAPWSPPVR